MKVEVYKVFGELYEKFGAAVIPLHGKSKRCKYKYSSKVFSVSDFCEDDVSGVGLILKRVSDLICIDIDCKHIDVACDKRINKDEIKKILLECIDKNVYLEESPSGFHVFMKVKNREKFISDVYEMYGSRFVANNVELFPDFDLRYVVIAPSIVEKGEYKQVCGDIFSVGYVDYDFVFSLISILRDILGARAVSKKNNGVSSIAYEVSSDAYEVSTKLSSNSDKRKAYDLINECIYVDGYVELLSSNKHKRLRQFLFRLERWFKNDRKAFVDFLRNVGVEVVSENSIAYRVRSIIVDDGRYADAYIFKNSLVYYDFHFTRCALQLLAYLLITRPKKFVKWLVDEVPDFLMNMLRYLKRFLSNDILMWLFEYMVSSESSALNFVFKLRKVFTTAKKSIKEKIEKWWVEGWFGRVVGLVEREFINRFVNVNLLVNKFRRFSCLKHSLCGVISMTKNSAERKAKERDIDFYLFKRILEVLGFKYYKKHKKFVRYKKVAEQYVDMFLELVEEGKLFEDLWDDSKFDSETVVYAGYVVSQECIALEQ